MVQFRVQQIRNVSSQCLAKWSSVVDDELRIDHRWAKYDLQAWSHPPTRYGLPTGWIRPVAAPAVLHVGLSPTCSYRGSPHWGIPPAMATDSMQLLAGSSQCSCGWSDVPLLPTPQWELPFLPTRSDAAGVGGGAATGGGGSRATPSQLQLHQKQAHWKLCAGWGL